MPRHTPATAPLPLCALLAAAPSLCAACSFVRVAYPDGAVSARTMEAGGYRGAGARDRHWPYAVVTHPRGAVPESYCNGTVSWSARYAHAVVTSSPTWATEAMNERGLTISGHTLRESRYNDEGGGAAPPDRPLLCWRDVARWAAAMHASIPDLVDGLRRVAVAWQGPGGDGDRLHWAVEDGVHTGVVLEYINGELVVHNNTVGVMTNDPPFDWHLRNLNNYVALRAEHPSAAAGVAVDTEVGVVPRAVGHGAGLLGLPGSASPPDRFVRLMYLRGVAALHAPPRNATEAVELAAELVAAMAIPKGSVATAPADTSGWEFTQWTALKVPSERKLYFRGYGEDRWRVVRCDAIGSVSRTVPVYQGTIADAAEDVTLPA